MFGTSVPEAAVDEHGDAAAGQDEVRRATLRQAPMQSEAPASSVNGPSKKYFRRRALLLPTGQVPARTGADPSLRHPANIRGLPQTHADCRTSTRSGDREGQGVEAELDSAAEVGEVNAAVALAGDEQCDLLGPRQIGGLGTVLP